MTKQSNELVALEWLIEPLNDEFDALHSFAAPSAAELLRHFAREYGMIANVLTMANLSEFAKLAQTIGEVADCFATLKNPAALSPKIIYASCLLQHEINRYATIGFMRRGMLSARVHYLKLVYSHISGGADRQNILQSAIDEHFSDQINLGTLTLKPLDDGNYQEINQAWRALSGQLIQSGTNGEQILKLRNLATHLAGAASEPILQKMWLFTALWLENLAANSEPLPSYYAHILGELDRVIGFQQSKFAIALEVSIWFESLIADMYVILAGLDVLNELAQNLFKHLNDSLVDDQTFFPHVLATIEGLVFALADNKIEMETLYALQERLSVRGWSFYARYVEQIIDDAKSAQSSSEMFAQMQWQLNTQLQDLYTAISSTAEVINAKNVQHESTSLGHERDVLREVRILMEEVKDGFAIYLQNKQVQALPKMRSFELLIKNLNDMGLFDAANVANKMAGVFAALENHAPTHIRWQLAHKIAESLSLFEMFLDNLAGQVFDHAILTRAEECVDEAVCLLNDVAVDEMEVSQVDNARKSAHQYVVLYDDAGEHAPEMQAQQDVDLSRIFHEPLVENLTVDLEDSSLTSGQDLRIEAEMAADGGLTDDAIGVDNQVTAQSDDVLDLFDDIELDIADSHLTFETDAGNELQERLSQPVSAPSVESIQVGDLDTDDAQQDDVFDDVVPHDMINDGQQMNQNQLVNAISSTDIMEDGLDVVLDGSLNHETNRDEQGDISDNDVLDETLDIGLTGESSSQMDDAIFDEFEIEMSTESSMVDFNHCDDVVSIDVGSDRVNEGVIADDVIGASDRILEDALAINGELRDNNWLDLTDSQDDEPVFEGVDIDVFVDDAGESSHDIALDDISKADLLPTNLEFGAQTQSVNKDDGFEDVFDETLVFDDNFGIDDVIRNKPQEISVEVQPVDVFDGQNIVMDDDIENDVDLFADGEQIVEVSTYKNDSYVQDGGLVEEVEVTFDDELDVSDAKSVADLTSNESVDLDLLSADTIAIDLVDDKPADDELIVDDLPSELLPEQPDELFLADDDEILLSDYVNEGTVDTVVPNLASSELLNDTQVADNVDGVVIEELAVDDVVDGTNDIVLGDEVAKGTARQVVDVSDEAAISITVADDLSSDVGGDIADDNVLIGEDDDNVLIGEDEGVEIDGGFAKEFNEEAVAKNNNILIGEDEGEEAVVADDEPHDMLAGSQSDHIDIEAQNGVSDNEEFSEVYLAAKASLKEDDFSHDDEFREIFIEEVDEVMEEMHSHLPKWLANPQNLKPLKEIRRNWHTLKGSGRMVGAFQVGETAWAIENMLNRVLDEAVRVNDDVVNIVKETAEIIPVMVQDFANSQPPSVDNALVVMRASNILAGKPMDEGAPTANSRQAEASVDAPELMATNNVVPNEQVFDTVTDKDECVGHDDVLISENNKSKSDVQQEAVLVSEFSDDDIGDDVLIGEDGDIILDDDVIFDDESVESIALEADQGKAGTIPSDMMVDQKIQRSNGVLPDVLLPFIETANATVHEATEVDEDIREIYIEEAGEVLETIIPLFDKYKTNPNKATLTDIRRGFHTLKGSGRMVGAHELGELAWSIENMLNRVLDETVSMDAGMQALIGDVLGEFASLVAIFEGKSGEYPTKIKLWEATAHAYSKGHGKDFDYRELPADGVADEQTIVQEVALNSVTEADQEEVAEDDKNVEVDKSVVKPVNDVLSLVEQAGELMSSTSPASPADDEENSLCQVFIEEARELLTEVSAFLDKHEDDSEVPVDNDVVRAFHTLRGASGLAPLASVGEVGAIIEHGLQSLQHHDTPMGHKHKQALKNAVSVIGNYLDDYCNANDATISQEVLAEFDEDKQEIEQLMLDETNVYHVEGLIEGIDDLLDAELELEGMSAKDEALIADYAKTQLTQVELLSSRTHDLPKFQSLLASLKPAYELMAEHTEQAQDDKFIDALLLAHHELIGLFDAMAGSMALDVDKSILNNLNAITLEKENYYQELGSTLKEQLKAEVVKEVALGDVKEVETTSRSALETSGEPVRIETISTDDELLEIFLDEALELDAEVTNVFGQWRDDKENLEHLKTLQRHLHTIKGGARLAGISSIGDLTHEAESVYERFTNGQMAVTDPWVRTMQRVQDVLSLQLDAVKNTKQSFFADGTIADLQSYLSAGEIPEGAVIAVPMLESAKEEVAAVNEPVIEELNEEERYQSFIDDSWQGVPPDKDILSVFLEEAKELAESSSEDFAAFRNNTSDVASLQSLQRKLHTIKGGARMVSANGVADLAHEMETVYEDLGNRRLPATRMVANLLFACHDWITAAVGLLESNYNPPRPAPLIDALHRFIKHPDSLNEVPTVSLEKEIDFINEYQAFLSASKGTRDISRMPPMRGVFGESVESSGNNEMIRISAPLLERMINLSGEAAINRARIDMNLASITSSIEEMGVTVQRLFDQLRRMDIELEEQILAQIDDGSFDEGFDPLEMDQYSSLNQLSKSLSESASDLLDIKATMLDKTRDGENLLLQLSRTQADLQDSLMNSRMVPFSRLTPRLQRIVRQTAGELGKNVDLTVINADDEMDRSILDRITSPLEHMLRNAVDHGVEMPTKRSELGKPLMGHITLEVLREGGEMVILLSDDGAGVNVEAVRNKAISQGLIGPDEQLSDNDIMQYIFNAGLSTTSKITQISGRGVGMDVVRTEIRQLGGSVSVESEFGKGSRFIIRVPLTVAMSDALIVRVADRQYAIPLVQIERVVQMNASELLAFHQSGNSTIKIDNKNYRLRYLNEILTGNYFNEIVSGVTLPVIIIKTQTGQALALQVDEIVGSRIEIVVKPLGRQLSNLSGISAATIMGDGSVMLILDLLALMRTAQAKREVKMVEPTVSRRRVIMVVDDSVTVRKVTSRFLERQGFEVIVAKDGVDAIEILQDAMPDLMLLDIEMPRMDGFEVATQVRHSPRLSHLPIIMITSRTGEKHRDRAFEIGVNDYMGKPFQEAELLERIGKLLNG